MKKFDFLKNIDKSISPGDNFFAYVNNNWIKKNPIPDAHSSWAIFHVVRDDIQHSLRDILEDLKKATLVDQALIKLRDFYNSGMNEARLNKEGIKPVMDLFSRIDKVKSKEDITSIVAEFHNIGIDILWGSLVEPDDKNSTKYIYRLFQSGLGLPDREYYLSDDKKFKEIRSKYITHITRLSQLYGQDLTLNSSDAKTILNIETRLAQASMSRVEQRDTYAMYNKTNMHKLQSLVPGIDWKVYFRIVGLKEKDLSEFLINQPKFMKEVNTLLSEVSVDDWKRYIKWHVMSESAGYLSEKLAKERWQFAGAVLSGAKKIRPRWKRVVSVMDSYMGDALGKLYVDKFFPREAKRRMDIMVKDIFAAYERRIANLDWMSTATKKKALEKLKLIRTKIGYPAKWENYKNLRIEQGLFIVNHWNTYSFAFKKMLRKLGKPIDKKEWVMTAPTVNAYYWPNMNEIVFPAGILQPPSFDLDGTDAMNYGAIGAVIGHELTHGFDDEGCRFDGHGNLREWWGKDDKKRFNLKAKKLVKQYDSYEVLPGMYCNGKLTLGENIADLGGVVIAYDALQRRLEKTGKRESVNGFTPEQQFFIANARDWAGSIRPEQERQNLTTDPHSPHILRVNAVLSNVNEFYEAFNVKPGDKLYRKPSERTVIW